MKKIKAIIIIPLICWHGLSFGQAVFNKVYDNSNFQDFASSVIQTPDNGFLVSGYSHNYSYSIDVALTIRTDSHGDTLWTKEYDFTPGADIIYTMCEGYNGTYLLGGHCKDSAMIKTDAFLAAIDSMGNLLWFKRYGGIENERCFNILKTSDGGYLFCGWTTTNTNSSYEDAWAVKTDSAGNQQWQHRYGGTSTDLFNAVVEVSTGYVFAGWTRTAANYMQAYLVKTDFTGNLIWQKDFGYTGWDTGDDIKITADGNFILTGTSQTGNHYDGYFIKADTAGSLIWQKKFGTAVDDEFFYKITVLSNGSFIAVGDNWQDYTNPNQSDGIIIKLDSFGDSIWMKSYEHYPLKDEYVMDMTPTSDGGFAIAGYIINNTLPQKNDYWLVKVDSMGCDDTSCAVTSVIEDHKDPYGLKIYPNPASTHVTIEYSMQGRTNVHLIISDVLGRVLSSIAVEENTSLLNIDLASMPKGMYFISLDTGSEIAAREKLMIIR